MSETRLKTLKADEKFASDIVTALNTKPLVIVPAVDKYSGAPAMLLGVVQDDKVCPIGRIMNVEEIEYGFELLIESGLLVQGCKVSGLELWYENRFIKPSRTSAKGSENTEPAPNGEHPKT